MNKLSDLPNIGIKLEKLLIDAGIETPEMLKQLGSKSAFIKIKNIDNTVCLSKLCALEGAIQEQRWHVLSANTKEDLKCFFQSLK